MGLYKNFRKSDCSTCPSLVICPATLCHHWSSEVEKFVPNKKDLTPFVYNGSMAQRMALKKSLLHEMALAQQAANGNLVVVTSYDIVRSDVDFFNQYQWTYLVLDEGHAIRNAKTKTTLAIKSVRANHRLILSGTPIQNSVIELWSLFDFLMPGFLGTEKQFNTKYTKPIVGSRNSTGKSVSKESQEAGVLAMEALHRQVLPFILRRMKEDVLKDLPPKITQDYYCELSPIQKLLYEDFAKEQKDKTAKSNNDNKMHVFQALQYLRKVCNHPKLVLHEGHKQYGLVQKVLHESHSNLHSLTHASKLPALKQLLHECGIGQEGGEDVSVVGQHRALVFCQLKAMMDIVETDLLKISMPSVTYLRLDGSIPPSDRHGIVTKFNNDVSIDLLLLTTSVGKFINNFLFRHHS
jgi:TATA-binding protein-associated factor